MRGSLFPIRGPRVWRDPPLLRSMKGGVYLTRTSEVHDRSCEALDGYMRVCVVDPLVPVSCGGGGWVAFELVWEHW
jgi:hypothetical protein